MKNLVNCWNLSEKFSATIGLEMVDMKARKTEQRNNQQPSPCRINQGEGSEIRDEISNKYCKWCNNWFLVTYFNKQSGNKDGLDTRCKSCRSIVHKAYHESEQGQRSYAGRVQRRKVRLENNPELKAKNKEQTAKRNHKRRIRMLIDREYREDQLAKRRDWNKTWYNLTGKFQKSTKKITDNEYYSERNKFNQKEYSGILNNIFERDNGKCVRCGSIENLEFDHILPVKHGGKMTLNNLQLLCRNCNRFKSGYLILANWQGVIR